MCLENTFNVRETIRVTILIYLMYLRQHLLMDMPEGILLKHEG